MFALCDIDADPLSVNLKCDPDRATKLREEFAGIRPGYHQNKKHWNTVECNDEVPEALVWELVRHSYDLVRASLKKAERDELENLS